MSKNVTIADRKRRGVCTRCGKRPPAPGVLDCRPCRQRHSQQRKERKLARVAAGICLNCDTPSAPYLFCEEHRRQKQQRKREYRLGLRGPGIKPPKPQPRPRPAPTPTTTTTPTLDPWRPGAVGEAAMYAGFVPQW